MDQVKHHELSGWNEYKLFKDPVYGYIPINRVYVSRLIDTQMMQRIKGVAQTGLRPVFSSATHDRFSHSLGVYKFGMAMYDSFASKLNGYLEYTCFPKWKLDSESENNVRARLNIYLKHWKTLLSIGCLLHDIGHPVQSHGFEFLYDDPYLDVSYDRSSRPVVISDKIDIKEQERVFNLFKYLEQTEEKKPEGNLRKELLKAFHENADNQEGPITGSPHERMSAYYILKDRHLRNNVEMLISESWESANKDGVVEADESSIKRDVCFIARMIIGWEYPVEKQLSFNTDVFFDSIRNCVIHILNGEIDADGIDYLMRNSYAAGYDTSKVDSTRLCNAYTAYEKNYVILPAFSKSALSVLEGYMSARNFEPKWLYSHHKVVYADLLTKRIYKYITRYLTDRIMLHKSVMLFLKHASKSALVCGGEQDFGTDLLLMPRKGSLNNRVSLNAKTLHSHIEQWSYPFYTYLLAPCRDYIIGAHHFNKTADADMETLFHWVFNELKQYNGDYSNYKQCLINQVVDNLKNSPDFSSSTKELRILLAESCLDNMSQLDMNAHSILKEWIETGNIDKTLLETIDIEAVIGNMLSGIDDGSNQNMLLYLLGQYKPLLSALDFNEFINLLDEYQTRRYRSSLWKSLPEYQLFMKECANKLGISLDDTYRYMVELIEEGMNDHGFSIFDGKAEMEVPELYREQFFFQQHEKEMKDKRNTAAKLTQAHNKNLTPVPVKTGKQIAQDCAKTIFTNTGEYDFSQIKLVVKFYRLKPKRFKKIHLLFNKQPIPLIEVFPQDNYSGSMFPYFYYQSDGLNSNSETILRAFQKRFIEFCRRYRETEVRSETVQVKKNQVFRDAIYGDIEMPDKFFAVVRTFEVQRLGRIRQLATADRSFPNATHTRLAHSIGTWHVMGMILQHFKKLYKSNPQLDFSQDEENCALLAALLHDLGHGPYSHAIEEVFKPKLDHEEMTRRIIMDKETELWSVLEREFGSKTPARVCELLKGTSSGKSNSGIELIYRTLISSQLDADRIDYLMRDNASCGMSFGHIDIQQLISSMRMLPDYNVEQSDTCYRLCFDDRYLPAIEQFIYARYQMYKNVYHDPGKLLYEQLIKRIFNETFSLLDSIKQDRTYSILRKINEGEHLEVSDYIALDDESLNGLIKKWAAGDVLKENIVEQTLIERANMISKLAQAFLNQSPMFERIDIGGQQRQYNLLAESIGKLIGKEYSSFLDLDNDFCSFIYVQGEDNAYKMYAEEGERKKNIVLRNMDDGTTSDYITRSMFQSATGSTTNTLFKTDYCYLFFSENLLEDDCKILGKTEETARQIRQLIDSAKPRKHIEIEKKFYCTNELLKRAEDYIDEKYLGQTGISKNEKGQKDTYYDYKINDEWVLFKNHYSFRCREKNGKYVFTVKIPTSSPNYHSPSQFARHEHEFESSEPYITDEVFRFLINTLETYEGNSSNGYIEALINGFKSNKDVKDKMEPQLIVVNQRITYRFEGKCEVCLDTVDYKTFDQRPVGSQDYQIEIELLDDPENWPILDNKIIDPLVQELGKDLLIPTSKSKLEKGLEYLRKVESN